MSEGDLYQVDVPHFCCGIVACEGVVVEAAPILRWAIGRRLADLESWVRRKGGVIKNCPPGEQEIAR